MQFVYGSYAHTRDQVHWTGITSAYTYSPNQKVQFRRVDWGLKGRLLGVSQADIMAQYAAVKTAYSVNGFSAGMLDDSGNMTPFFLDNSLTIGGVMVTSPISHGEISRSMGITYLDYTFSLSAEFPMFVGGTVFNYEETITFNDIDGGPIQVERTPAIGPPIIQNVTEQSFFYATQTGSITTSSPFPPGNPPLWPNALRRQEGAQSRTHKSPSMIRGVAYQWETSWSYSFRSATRLYGLPKIVQ